MDSFFLDKIKSLRRNIPLPTGDPASKLKDLKNSPSTGVDYIDTKTIKLVADIITPALTHIINLSIQTSTFPAIWNWAKVIVIIPLLKAENADSILPKSYRPVALLPILSKVLEKVGFRQLVKY